MPPSAGRRRFIASAAALAGTAVAGCTAPSRNPVSDVERWSPTALLDPRFRAVRYVDAAAIRTADPPVGDDASLVGALGTAEPWEFDPSTDAAPFGPGFEPASVDHWLHVGGSGRPPRAAVATGDFDPGLVADRLETGRWLSVDAGGDLRAFQHLGRHVVAVGDEVAYATSVETGEDPMGPVRSFRDAAAGDGRYATAEPAYDVLCDAVGDSQFAELSTVTEPLPQTDVDRGLFEGLVTRGVGGRVEGDTLRATFAAVFDEDSPLPMDAVRSWAGRLDAFDRTSVESGERSVEVTATGLASSVPVGQLTWDRLFSAPAGQTSSR